MLGVDATGSTALANAGAGVQLAAGSNANRIGGATALERNVLSGNGAAGA
mgnify:CR=1 FL=1